MTMHRVASNKNDGRFWRLETRGKNEANTFVRL